MNKRGILLNEQRNLNGLKRAAREHLTEVILPFWAGLCDKEHGGYYGYMDYNLQIKKNAVKGCILNSRILWFFSNAVLTLKTDAYLPYAQHAFQFLKDCFIDRQYGGVYWSVTYDGKVEDDTKHVYNQAFAIYALSSYYDASGEREALDLAWSLYHMIENACRDEYGYLEAFSREFLPIDNGKLSENGVMAYRTMNTLLHVFEAYSELYRVTGEKSLAHKLIQMLELFETRIYNPVLGRQEVFFDRNWTSLVDLHSYGHDIESSWLLEKGCRLLKDGEWIGKMDLMTGTMARQVWNQAYHDGSLWNEREKGVNDKRKVWWVQAEAVVGFFNAWQKTPEATVFLETVYDIWNYIMDKLVDERAGSEWFSELDSEGKPNEMCPTVDPWKCPYHNGRMCMELMTRISEEGGM